MNAYLAFTATASRILFAKQAAMPGPAAQVPVAGVDERVVKDLEDALHDVAVRRREEVVEEPSARTHWTDGPRRTATCYQPSDSAWLDQRQPSGVLACWTPASWRANPATLGDCVVTGTACGRAGFTGGSPAVSHTNMLRRIVRVVWERRRLTSVEEHRHGHRGHDKFIGPGR